MPPLLQQVTDAVTAAGNDANTAYTYALNNCDETMQGMIQAIMDDLAPLLAESAVIHKGGGLASPAAG